MDIRSLEGEDLHSILAIQRKCPDCAQWVAADYERLVNDVAGLILVSESATPAPPKLLGFAAFRRLIGDAELMNLAVDPEHRRRGIGRALLEGARNWLMQAGVNRLFLEVRPSNKPALALYHSLGFAPHSLRKDYYWDPREDAYILCLRILRPVDKTDHAVSP